MEKSDIPGKDFYDKKNKLKHKYAKVLSSLTDEIWDKNRKNNFVYLEKTYMMKMEMHQISSQKKYMIFMEIK